MVWYFLFILIAVTLAILASISLYKINQSRKNKKQLKLTDDWKTYFDTLFSGDNNESHTMQAEDRKKLYSIEQLMAFFTASKPFIYSEQTEVSAAFRQFIRENKHGWVNLGQVYGKKNVIEKAYFAYICEKLRINDPEEYDELTEIMLEFAVEPSINSRENALKALYAFGNSEAVVEAYRRLSKIERTHHRKLVTDGLLTFTSDQDELAQALYAHFEEFGKGYQIAIIDFFRFSGKALSGELIALLKKGSTDKEFVCALLRYYEKYPVQQYKETILSYVSQPNERDWEVVSTAATVLSQYPGEDTIQALKAVLTSGFWYVRLNAARSIAELGVEEASVLDILEGQDVYAREQLVYQLTNKRERGLLNG